MSPQEIAVRLRECLGLHVTAYLVGADARQFTAYARGTDVPDLHARRLRESYGIVKTIEAAYDTATAKAWLFGTNPQLGDRTPIDVIARAATTAQFAEAHSAARAFAATA